MLNWPFEGISLRTDGRDLQDREILCLGHTCLVADRPKAVGGGVLTVPVNGRLGLWHCPCPLLQS
jgi:hypothetical protein